MILYYFSIHFDGLCSAIEGFPLKDGFKEKYYPFLLYKCFINVFPHFSLLLALPVWGIHWDLM